MYTLTVKSWMDWGVVDWLAIEWSDLILTKRCLLEELGLYLIQESRTLVEIDLEIKGVRRELKRVFLEAKSKDFGGEKRVFWVRNLAEEQSMVDIELGIQDIYIQYRGVKRIDTKGCWYVSRDAEMYVNAVGKIFMKRGRWRGWTRVKAVYGCGVLLELEMRLVGCLSFTIE